MIIELPHGSLQLGTSPTQSLKFNLHHAKTNARFSPIHTLIMNMSIHFPPLLPPRSQESITSNVRLVRLQTKFNVMVMFSQASFCPQVGQYPGGIWYPGGSTSQEGGGVCIEGRLDTQPIRYYEIQSTGRWWASYWNAFLLCCRVRYISEQIFRTL